MSDAEKIATICIDEHSPRQVLLDALNKADSLRSLTVTYVTAEGNAGIVNVGNVIDRYTMFGLFAAKLAPGVAPIPRPDGDPEVVGVKRAG